MTKQEILKLLRNGVKLNQIFDFISGQECEIYKADDWTQAREDDIVYIPDISLNDICIDKNIHFEDERLYILRQFYRKKDFVLECHGNEKIAEDLFNYVDWQHPDIQDLLDSYDKFDADEFCRRYGCLLSKLTK